MANFLFESDLFAEETEIWKKCGASVHEGFFDDRRLKSFAPTVARGSIQFDFSVAAAMRQKGWPDIKWPFNNPWRLYGYEFLKTLGPEADLLNHDVEFYIGSMGGTYSITPGTLEDMLDQPGYWPKWIRSEAGTKGLVGGVYTAEQFAVWIEFAKQNGLLSQSLVTAAPKKIFEEWRLIFVDGKYISGSQYHSDGRKPVDGYVPDSVTLYGYRWNLKFGHNWKGNYVLDIAYTDNGFKVVEINNLLTSGWYAADLEKVITHIGHVVNTL